MAAVAAANSMDTQVLRSVHVGMLGSQHIHEN